MNMLLLTTGCLRTQKQATLSGKYLFKTRGSQVSAGSFGESLGLVWVGAVEVAEEAVVKDESTGNP